MNKWPTVELSEVCELKYGKSLPASKRVDGEFAVFGSNGVVGSHTDSITDGPTIIVGRKGSFGEVNWSNQACWPIDTTYYIDGSATDADLRWLFHRLGSLGLTQLNRAAAVPGLNREDAYRKAITLPPIEEQRRIAAILDHADALRAKRREALARLEELTQSIFIDMFGDPVVNPFEYPIRALGDIAEFYAGGTLPEGEGFAGQPDGFALLKVSDLNLLGNERVLHTSQGWSARPGARSATCPAGSVIIPKRGGAIGTNKKRLTSRPSVLDPNLMAITPHQGQLCLEFLYAWFERLDLNSLVSGSSVPQLNKKDLAPLAIPIPPYELQLVFAARVNNIELIRSRHRANVAELDTLFASLQSRAFRGEL
ncbi:MULTISPECIES: restriction endonuclease subunit S [Nocardia]|uniref:restriction endonuclease subunit S n=1 Tax=Nocardia TaxID=1817 RepID=UPI002454EBE7|nr:MULTISPECIES: restriction endonuclease subunit S [Nocardia]